ncbi:response regulator transcription factor [Synechococcus sp. PCC 7336]|uniref:response regulator transcription factor n=1 Tax=Synechococcus sp. PCC 7336 TaxID=195250 RepID=UPI00034BEFB5|nr:response regulator transcription factor [Synechococcus sp. PCC 7336]
MAIDVLILEAHPLVQLGLVRMLEEQAQFQIWAVADSANMALALLQRGLFEDRLPDVLLMSPAIPDIGRSLNFVRQLQQSNTRVRILALLDVGDAARSQAAALVNSGVQGCCLKSKPVSHILQALSAIASNTCWMDLELNDAQPSWGDRYRQAAPTFPHRSLQLSNRERQVLRELTAGKSNREIATTLAVAESTIKSHIVRILRKMGVRDRTQAAVCAMREGLV